MNWEAVGAIGDAVGGIGVVLSLLYLASQTRSNTRAIQAASSHQVNEAYASVSMSIATDPILVSVMDRALADADDLSPEEISRFRWILLSMFRRAESTFIQTELGTLESDSWIGVKSTLHMALSTRHGATWWDETSRRFNPRFRAYVDSSIRA